jgi:hypothetical protein
MMTLIIRVGPQKSSLRRVSCRQSSSGPDESYCTQRFSVGQQTGKAINKRLVRIVGGIASSNSYPSAWRPILNDHKQRALKEFGWRGTSRERLCSTGR